MKSLPIYETFGDLMYGTFDNAQRTQTKLKVSNLNPSDATAVLTCYQNSQPQDSTTFTLGKGQMGERIANQCGNSSSGGLLEINTSAPGAIVADTLRFRRNDSVHVPERLR